MTVDTEVRTAVPPADPPATVDTDPGVTPAGFEPPEVEPDETPLSATRIAVAGGLAAAGAAIVLGGLFQGQLARLTGLAAVALGAGLVGLAAQRGRSWMQYAAAPAVFVAGYAAALLLPNETGVTGTVPELVRAAIANGGLAKPPLPFDPGWRFLAVSILGLVAAAAVSLAVGFRKPRAAVLVPLPLLLGGALNQPPGRELVGGIVGLGFLLAALSVAYSADLARTAEVSRAFELRRLATSLVAAAGCLGILAALSQASVLFPDAARNEQAKPQKPTVVPLTAVKDRPLFEVRSQLKGPWRLGVLDAYDADAWLLPPFDPARAAPVAGDGALPGPASAGPVVASTFTVRDITGYTLPTPPRATKATATRGELAFDPRLGVTRTRTGAPSAGFTYRVEATRPPNGAELAKAAALPVPDELRSYLTAPPPPLEVTRLLAKAPKDPWNRLQALRTRLYESVVAAGAGLPADVPPAKVAAMLNGGRATPYEIVAGEALLARWAGLPSRIGYGYHGGTKVGDGVEFRPRDGANWLEVYAPGIGWTPILGTPRQAVSSLNDRNQNNSPRILPSKEMAIQVYVPVLNRDPQLLFEVVRYWVLRAIPTLLLLYALWRLVPVPARWLRRRRRAAWAAEHGPAGRIAVAYAEFRDTARDLGVDDGSATPLGFLDEVEDDVEHRELAWLTTRALWGDLQRDLRPDDAVAAERLSGSLRRRLQRGQPGLVRLGALTSRASLQTPYDGAVPNAWPAGRPLPSLPSLRLPRPMPVRLRRAGAS